MATASSNRWAAEMFMRLPWVGLVALVLAWPTPVLAQLGRQLESGGVSWTPAVAIRDAGTDSNVFSEPGDGRSDRVMTFTPSVQAKGTTRRLNLQGDGLLDFVYYERFIQERAIQRRGNGRVEFEFGRISPFVTGGYANARERQPDVDLRVRHRDRTLGAGVSTAISANGTIEVALSNMKTRFAGGTLYQGVDLATALDRTTRNLNLGLRYRLTALTNLGLDASIVRDNYVSDVNKTSERRPPAFE